MVERITCMEKLCSFCDDGETMATITHVRPSDETRSDYCGKCEDEILLKGRSSWQD